MSLPLLNCDEILIYSNVTVGDQTVQLIVDTGSSDTWVKEGQYLAAQSPTQRTEVRQCEEQSDELRRRN